MISGVLCVCLGHIRSGLTGPSIRLRILRADDHQGLALLGNPEPVAHGAGGYGGLGPCHGGGIRIRLAQAPLLFRGRHLVPGDRRLRGADDHALQLARAVRRAVSGLFRYSPICDVAAMMADLGNKCGNRDIGYLAHGVVLVPDKLGWAQAPANRYRLPDLVRPPGWHHRSVPVPGQERAALHYWVFCLRRVRDYGFVRPHGLHAWHARREPGA